MCGIALNIFKMNYTVDEIRTGKFRMNYLRFGTGKRNIVILPGLSLVSVMPSAPAVVKRYEIFCDDFTVYLFDRRSDLPDEYTVFDAARDTAEAISLLGLEKTDIFGASQGGMIASVIAADHPELVRRLALGSSACRVGAKAKRVIGEWIGLAKTERVEELCLSFGEKIYPPDVFEKSRDAFAGFAEFVTKEDLARFIILAEGTAGLDLRLLMKRIECPVLAVGDDGDAVLGGDSTPRIAELMKDRPGFDYYIYSGFGHAAYDTAPDYPRRLYDFFVKERND